MSMVACEDASRLVALAILPMVRYTGQALLSPRNWDSWVLSDDKIIGQMVVPDGSICLVKSTGRGPHFVNDFDVPMLIQDNVLGGVFHRITEYWILQQLADTFYRISVPQLELLSLSLSVEVLKITMKS